jgi:BolA protein
VKNTLVQEIISRKLTNEFNPDILLIVDESEKHANHNPDALKGGTHFRIKMSSKKFMGMSKVEQHRSVYTVLDDEIKNGVHALALTLQPT